MNSPVSYCINTYFCGDTINPGHENLTCQDCGANLLVGDRYRLTEILKHESSATEQLIYKGYDTLENKSVVVKIVDSPKPEARKYLQREYEFLKLHGIPHLLIDDGDYFEWAPDPEQDFFKVWVLVLPYIEGIDTCHWIQENGPISEEKAIEWLNDILDDFEILSDMSAIHRDIKPENIVIQEDGELKLIDFGSVRMIDAEYVALLEGKSLNAEGSVRTGTRIQSLGYSAPEQLIGKAVIQSDFYALGITLKFWLTGKTPRDCIDEDIEDWSRLAQISETFVHFVNWLSAPKAAQTAH